MDPQSITSNKRPLSLNLVAGMFFVGGALALAQCFFGLLDGRFVCNPAFLGIFIGRGLFKLQQAYRVWALVSLWIVILAVGFVTVLLMIFPVPSIGTISLEEVPKPVTVLGALLVLALCAWQIHVLTRPHIRELFSFACERKGPFPDAEGTADTNEE